MPKPLPKIKILSDASDAGALSIKYADIETLKFLPDNIKGHDIEAIIANINRYGFVDPILINGNTIHNLDGNGTLESLLLMRERRVADPNAQGVPQGIIERIQGKESIRKWYAPIIDIRFNQIDELTLAISLNRISEKGGIDASKAYPVLKRLLESQKDNEDGEFVRTGYDAEALEHIRRLYRFNQQMAVEKESAGGKDAEVTPDDVSDPDFAKKLNDEKWHVKIGDVWQIGRHRLMCGDSRSEDDFGKLTAGSKVRLVFSSPPYDNQRTYQEGGFDWTDLMCKVFDTLEDLTDPADIVINLGVQYKDAQVSFYWNNWLEYCKEISMPLYGLYVWDKGFGYPGEYHGRLSTSHEYLFHFSIGHAKANKWIETTGATLKRGPSNFSKRKEDGSLRPGYTSPDKLAQAYKIPDSVVRMFNEQGRGIHTKGHPATFPVALPEFMMETWSGIGDTVYEPFSGSGSSLLAGENTDRCVRAMEISPNYCALALERFAQAHPAVEIKKL